MPRHPETQPNLQRSSPADSDPEPLCEFTNTCTTNTKSSQFQFQSQSQSQDPESPSVSAPTINTPSKHPRKVISHIFGRNKTATKLFPPHVWVHYCRKHYQRARYRSREWPFTQCDLLLDSLRRMEAWGGVAGFEVILRRREVERVDEEGEGEGDAGQERVRRGLRSGSGMAGDARVGRTDSNANANADADADARVKSTARARTRPRSFSSSRTETDNGDEDYEDSSSAAQTRSKSKRNGVQNKRKRPVIEAAPVPAWLREEVGTSKSFDDVRGIIYRLQDHLTRLHDEGRVGEIRFPDIEILPSFQKWVLDRAADATARANKQRRGASGGGQRRERQSVRG